MAREVREQLIRDHLLEAASNAPEEEAQVLRALAGSTLVRALSGENSECYLAAPPSALHLQLGINGLQYCCGHDPRHCSERIDGANVAAISESLGDLR